MLYDMLCYKHEAPNGAFYIVLINRLAPLEPSVCSTRAYSKTKGSVRSLVFVAIYFLILFNDTCKPLI
jgi:hypothetical protein